MKAGSIILVEGRGFLPDQIRAHMRAWGRLQGKGYALPYNHAETVIRYQGHLVAMGARAKGAGITPLDEYLEKHPRHVILEPVQPLDEVEMVRLENYAEDVCFRQKRKYQNAMFLAWIFKIKSFGLWDMGDRTDKRVYCYELAARCAQLTGRWDVKTNLVSIYDLYENSHFKSI